MIRTTLGSPFIPDNLIIETFEGLGLGTRIACLKFSGETIICGIRIPRAVKPMLMAFAYGLTTPIGQAIGLALLFSPGTSYDPASRSALILVGTMNALSAGLLLWASLVELLAAGTLSQRLSINAQARLIIVLSYRLLRRRKNDRHHGSRPCMEDRGVRSRGSRCCGDGNCRSMGLSPY